MLKHIAQCSQMNETYAKDWYDQLKGVNISTIDHLEKAITIEKCWEKISIINSFVRDLIRDYVLLNIRSKSNNPDTTDPYEKSPATLLGDIHRVRRYFHYKNGTLTNISLLDCRAVDAAIEEIRKFYDDDGNILTTIEKYLQTFCLNTRLPDEEERNNQRSLWENEATTVINLGYETKDVCKKAPDKKVNWRSDIECSQQMKQDHDKKIKTEKTKLAKLQKEYIPIKNEYEKYLTDIKTDERKIIDYQQLLQADLNEQYKKLTVKYGHGLLLYGPPGTGKSELLKRIAIYTGITMVTPALSAGELNRPYVGETERILVAMMSRANTISYLICVMTIDEIDGLAPKRDSQAQSSKVDGISVLLSHIEGAKDIPNLIVFEATNRRNMMDEAFLRRMQTKCFVGRPSPNIRKKMLQPLVYKDTKLFSTSLIDFLVKLTTNFSGAAIGAFQSSIVVLLERFPDLFNTNFVIELADTIARESSCWFGISTLADIYRRHPDIFNLEQKFYSIEFKEDDEPSSKKLLNKYETSISSLLARFVSGCSSRNIDNIRIIDLNFLTQHNAFNDNQIFELLSATIFECNEYNRSMFIFDIDSLIRLKVSDSDTSQSISIDNNNLYQYVRQQCSTANVEKKDPSTNDKNVREKWIVIIVKHPWLRRQLVNDIEFKKTSEEIQDETEHTCPKCSSTYIPAKSNPGSCQYHNGFIFDAKTKNILTRNGADRLLRMFKISSMNSNDKQQPKLIWACCLGIDGLDLFCQKGNCGLPKELQTYTNDSSEQQDPIVQTQELFANNKEARKNYDQFLPERQSVNEEKGKFSEHKS